MPIEMRPITDEEFVAFNRTFESATGERTSDSFLEPLRHITRLDRTLVCLEDGRMVGTASAYAFELTLPGAMSVPVAAVTSVSVLPSHRRQGLLSGMMRRQLADVRARGEAIAILQCSESLIYGRFGYGLATSAATYEIEREHTAFARPLAAPGRVALVSHEEGAPLVPQLHDRARRLRPGGLGLPEGYWKLVLRDPNAPLGDQGPRFFATYTAPDGTVEGIVYYRVRSTAEHGFTTSRLSIGHLISTTPEAYAALWHFCLHADLMKTIHAPNRSVEEPLRWLLADPRRLRVASLTDDVWVRLVDVAAALAARRYATAGRLVLEVADAFCPDQAGRYALEGGPEGATCQRTTDEPDLTLEVADLGATYLGGVRFATLAAAGRAHARTPDALARADALFRTDVAPWSGNGF
jgi:predicted acetyltransferase